MGLHNVHRFPVHGLLPKEETQSASFIRNNPEFDGRGTVIAILDTGVDPGAPGLQITTDGRPKVIDILDCTGSGDVQCTTVVEATVTEVDGKTTRTLPGLSGRTLTIGEWNNPTGKYKLGLKRSTDIFPKPLVDRLQKDRKNKFEIAHQHLVTKIHRELEDLEKSQPKEDKDEYEKLKADYKTRLEVLKEQWKSYEDPGLLIDCLVFHDGEKWRAAVDMNESGDLTNAQLLTNYADEQQFVRWSDDSLLNFSVNIYDEGETLSIVTLAGSHGTHVAAISAAHYPDDPQLNGVAPGAQIISLKIGDTRLGSMETGTGLVRAAIELARLKPDLANISYGEAASIPNTGRFVELLRDDVINKAGCIVVSSAGNAGPALTTVGAPGGTSSGIIGVGAYVTQAMMEAEYAMLDTVQDGSYTWSSRGPTADGDIGVDIYAPGAAVTSVPQYTVQNSQLMNGTSMSSPNCCGCLALLVGALKSENIPYTPYRIKAAIQNTGSDIGDQFNVKFIQVEKAWEHLTNAINAKTPFEVHYDVAVLEKQKARGIYLRDLDETSNVQQVQVEIKPRFFREDAASVNEQKVNMQVRVGLVGTRKWISAPEFLALNNGGRNFNIRVDPTGLDPGFHFGEILGYDTENIKAGPLFSIPVTICKPESAGSAYGRPEDTVAYYRWNGLTFEPGKIVRKFVSVLTGANFAELVVRSNGRNSPARFIVHLMQLQEQTRYPTHEHSYSFSLSRTGSTSEDQSVYTKYFPVLPYATLEVCLAQFWSSLDSSEVDVEIKFHGIFVGVGGDNQGGGVGAARELVLGGSGFGRVDVWCGVRREEVVPSVSLDALRRFIRPNESAVSPLKSRDVLPDTKQLHQLVLTYTLKISDSGAGVNVTPRCPRVNQVLYDAYFESFVLIVFDANKKQLSYQDIYPKAVKLTDGTYTIRIQLVSPSLEFLDKFTSMPLSIDQALSKNISLTAYTHLGKAAQEDNSGVFKKGVLEKGDRSVFWIGCDGVSVPKDGKQGDLLVGKLDVVGGGKKVDGGLFTMGFIVPPAVEKDKKDNNGDKEEEKSEGVLIKEAVRDLEVGWIKKMKDDKEREVLIAKLEKEWGEWLPFWVARLEWLGEKAEKEEKEKERNGERISDETLKAVESVVEKVLELSNEREVMEWFGVRRNAGGVGIGEKEGKEIAKKGKEMEKRKEAIILAYTYKAWCTKQRVLSSASTLDELGRLLDTLVTWLPDPPTSNTQYLLLWSWYMKERGLYGEVLKVMGKWVKDGSKVGDSRWDSVVKVRDEVVRELEWGVWEEYDRRWAVIRRPAGWAIF